MQDKSTLGRILACGKDCFLKYTFKSAPLRKIVAEAGVTTGAFYGYFANKEELFYALTDETAKGLMELLNSVASDMDTFPPEEKVFKMCGAYISRIPEIVDYLLEHRDEMRLLISCSQGTRYEDFFSNLQRRNESNISKSAADAGSSASNVHPMSVDTVRLLMDGYFSILAKLILDETDRDKIIRCMAEVAKVYEVGILASMQEGEK